MKGINGQTETRLCELKDNGDLEGFYVLQPLHSTTKENIITKSVSRGRAHVSHSFQSTARFTLMRTPAGPHPTNTRILR